MRREARWRQTTVCTSKPLTVVQRVARGRLDREHRGAAGARTAAAALLLLLRAARSLRHPATPSSTGS